jgi:hypothetical protein
LFSIVCHSKLSFSLAGDSNGTGHTSSALAIGMTFPPTFTSILSPLRLARR